MADLGAVLRLPIWRSRARHHAGPTLTAASVNAVLLVRDRPEQVEGPEGSLYVVLDTDLAVWRWDGLVRAAANASAAALLFAATELERPTRVLADRLGTPIYRAAAEGDLPALTSAAMALVAQPGAQGASLATAFCITALTGPADPQELLDAAAELAGTAAWLWEPGQTDPLTTDALGAGDVPPRSPVADHRVREVSVADGSGLQLATMLGHSTMTVGLAPLAGGVLTQMEAGPLLHTLALAITAGRDRQRLAAEAAGRAARDLLDELLAAGTRATTALEQRAEEAGFPLAGWQIGFAVTNGPDANPVSGAARLNQVLRSQGITGVVIPRTEHLIGWLGAARRPDAASRTSLAARLSQAVRTADRSPDVAIGIGRPVRGIDGLQTTLDEAREALAMATVSPQGNRMVSIHGLGISTTIRSWTSTSAFRAVARKRLEPLQETPELLDTLRRYLDSALSVTATAKALEVHRNTVMARIARIETLLGVSLSDPDERLSLDLAMRSAAERREQP